MYKDVWVLSNPSLVFMVQFKEGEVSDSIYKDVPALSNPALVFMVHSMVSCLLLSIFRLDLTDRECVVTTTNFFYESRVCDSEVC